MVISGVCVIAVAPPKRIAQFNVFLITASFSCFAYIWLLLILMVFSPDVVEVWEGVLTLVWFALLVGCSGSPVHVLLNSPLLSPAGHPRLPRRHRHTEQVP